MAERLRVLRKGLGRVAGHGNVGLASNFIALAHVNLKLGGAMAMVVPPAQIRAIQHVDQHTRQTARLHSGSIHLAFHHAEVGCLDPQACVYRSTGKG